MIPDSLFLDRRIIMKELLIIRSVSFQQLDLNLTEIKKKFPNYRISILTHEHGVRLAKKYKDISNIYVYPYFGAFNKSNRVYALDGKKFDAIIIPVTNITGVGFNNVIKYGMTIKADERYICNVISKISKIGVASLLSKYIRFAICNILSIIISLPVIVVCIPITVIKSLTLKAKQLGEI